MDMTEKSIAILYHHIPPERILDLLNRQTQTPLASQTSLREIFLHCAEITLHGYSGDEQALAFTRLTHLTEREANRCEIPKSVFVPLVEFGAKTLALQHNEPLCQFSRILSWREMYHILGQDMIVCAYLACIDRRAGSERKIFDWPAILKTDYARLHYILKDGIAENHYHLKGSSYAFSLVWCQIMNNLELTDTMPGQFSHYLHPASIRAAADNIQSLKERLLLAALLRSILFRALRREDFSTARIEKGRRVQTPFCSLDMFQARYIHRSASSRLLQDDLSILQECYGARIQQPDGTAACLDYALEPAVFNEAPASPFRVMMGERSFLYHCFSASFRSEFTGFEQDLFYLYLLLKTIFRGEMIQSNKETGFQNFDQYQNRKDSAWEGAYQWEAYRMALSAPFSTQSVVSLEARITPADSQEGIFDKIRKCDEAKHSADSSVQNAWDTADYKFNMELHAETFREMPYFYVMHFIKHPDAPPVSPGGSGQLGYQLCRHNDLRKDTRRRAVALATALSKWPYLCYRIRGIDGCANEVNCRPEVFGTAFRFLRNFCPKNLYTQSPIFPEVIPHLSITYHAGEDFYDLADGLRAIDEAVRFLEYRRGDRLGHALALGVDPLAHYKTKSMSTILPQQNYLDNLVWLIYRGQELGVRIDPQQYGLMKQEAFRLLRKIYERIFAEKRSITLQDYYASMLLRGDEPELYQTTRFDQTGICRDFYAAWGALRDSRRHTLTHYRNNQDIALLYYAYHYDATVRNEGAKTITVDITQDYMTVIRQMQDAMQRYLERQGIIIECNPTSNVLIGTFGGYEKHPVIQFNNTGLTTSAEQRQSCPQLHVCINTDDLGVFDTSLEFEYALLMGALSKQMNTDGTPCYTTSDILSYIHNLQEMGRQAVFPSA